MAKNCIFARWYASQSQVTPVVSVARITAQREPGVKARILFPPLVPLEAERQFRYISVYFRIAERRANKAYVFPIAKGSDPIDTLNSYALRMARDGDYEHTQAFQRYLNELSSETTPLPPFIQKMKRSAAERALKISQGDIPRPGKERDMEITNRMRQGLSFVDMESIFHRTAEHIAREANRIWGESAVKLALKSTKRGVWSDYEVEALIELRKRGFPHAQLSYFLRRETSSIQKKLQELRSSIVAPAIVHGHEEELPESREFLFDTRLKAIWQVLLQSEMTQTWRETLLNSENDWLSTISRHVPEYVKQTLGSLRSPTWEDIESLPLIKTNDAGVYARLATTRHDFHMARDRWLYIGSASRYGGGLARRIDQHTMRRSVRHESRLQFDMRTKRLKGNFVTLMVMKMDRPDAEAVLEVRRTVVLAEAIFTIWLGALEQPPVDLERACPWDIETLQWTGWSSHNPLMCDIVLPVGHRIVKGDEINIDQLQYVSRSVGSL